MWLLGYHKQIDKSTFSGGKGLGWLLGDSDPSPVMSFKKKTVDEKELQVLFTKY